MSHPNLRRIAVLAALAAFSPLGAASADPQAPAPAVAAPPPATVLAQAKTIRVHEAFALMGKDGAPTPFFENTVLIRRPGLVKVIVTQAKPGTKPHQYVADGKAEHEYNALTNQYTIVKPHPDGRSASQLRDMSQIDLILRNGQMLPPAPKMERTITDDTLDGKPMVLTTDTSPARVGSDGISRRARVKVWTDAATGLPYRCEDFMAANGTETPNTRLTFSDWAFNTPIPAAQIAWVPPAGSQPYSAPTLLALGTPAPDFEVVTSEGKTVHLSDFKGKTVVLDFWATWCGPCQRSMPHLEQVYRQIKDKNVVVLGLCVWDEKPAYDKWVAKNSGPVYTFPVAFDPAGRSPKSIAGSLYKVTMIPTQYVINKEGQVAAYSIGYEDGDHTLEANLNKAGVEIAVPQAKKTASK